jgi:glyoxylase-like metal-dependent hydrolase (beta-lactamase superfamily II)
MLPPFSPAPGFVLYPIRGWLGVLHLLYEEARHEAVLIDTGLVGECGRLASTLSALGLTWRDIRAILLTHGHLDHTGNLAFLKQQTGAPLYAHPAEQAHIDGRYAYHGAARLCGWMERVGRFVLRYRSAPIDNPLQPGAVLPFWGGLEVVGLPGHTDGHCGYFSRRFDLLFSGDLFASYGFSAHLPAPFLNSRGADLPGSLQTVRQLAPRYVVPNHYSRGDYTHHRAKFDRLAARNCARERLA